MKLNNVVNGIIDVVPDEINIPGSDLYLEGGLARNFRVKKDTYILAPFDISLQSKKHPYNAPNNAVFGDYVQEDYQLQIFLSEYLLESGLHALFLDGLLRLNGLSVPIDTTALDIVLLGKLTRNGWAYGQKCVIDIEVIGETPDIFITKKNGLSFSSQLAIDLKCKRNKDATEFDQVFTIVTQPILFTGKIEISNKLTVKLTINDFVFNIDKITNS